MSDLNEAQLIGRLGKDPETRRLQNGAPVVNLSIATSEHWRDKGSGERRERVEWHRVVIFNEGLAKVAEQYLRKGSRVFLRGAIQTHKWTDQQGVEKYSTEIVLQKFRGELRLLDGAKVDAGDERDEASDFGARDRSGNSYEHARSGGERPVAPRQADMDEEIPFAPEMR